MVRVSSVCIVRVCVQHRRHKRVCKELNPHVCVCVCVRGACEQRVCYMCVRHRQRAHACVRSSVHECVCPWCV